MNESIKTEIVVNEQKISIIRINKKEYISLTDLARYANPEEPKIPIYVWMRNSDVIAYWDYGSNLTMNLSKVTNSRPLKVKQVKTVFTCLLKNGLKKQTLLV